MQFENAGSQHALLEDQQACDQELQTPTWAQYVREAKGQLDPWQVCIEHKGWKRVDRPVVPLASAKLEVGGSLRDPSQMSSPRSSMN